MLYCLTPTIQIFGWFANCNGNRRKRKSKWKNGRKFLPKRKKNGINVGPEVDSTVHNHFFSYITLMYYNIDKKKKVRRYLVYIRMFSECLRCCVPFPLYGFLWCRTVNIQLESINKPKHVCDKKVYRYV